MKHTRERKRAALMARAQALIKEFLNWQEQAERPNLTQTEDVALESRARFGQELAATTIADQDTKQPIEAAVCSTYGAALRYKGQKAPTPRAVWRGWRSNGVIVTALAVTAGFSPGPAVGVVGRALE